MRCKIVKMSECENKMGRSFIDLLWDDILFTKILPYLSIKELFILRGLSTKYKLLIDSYFKQMKYVNLGQYSHYFTPVAFKVLSKHCTQLRTLILANCVWLTDDLIVPLFENNVHLKRIILNRCSGLTSVCLQPVIINCWNLECLSLAGCSWLTVGCLQSITLHQRNMVEVDFSDCPMIDKLKAINNFVSISHELRVLNLSKLSCVCDSTLSILARSAKQLETLNIRECWQVSNYGVSLIIEYCHNLKGLVCIGCPEVIPHYLKIAHRPGLRVISNTPIVLPGIRIIIPRVNV